MTSVQGVPSSSWADVVEDLPPNQVIQKPDGTKLVISYKLNDQGKKVKVTQKIREKKVTEIVHPAVAARRKWARYGEEKNNTTEGPDLRTTQFGDAVRLHLSSTWKKDMEKEQEEKKQGSIQPKKTLTCRLCTGAHLTAQCPYKETLGADLQSKKAEAEAEAAVTSGSSSYMPPHLRNGGKPGAGNGFERDDSTTIRITQLNDIVDERMIDEELLFPLGPAKRITVVRNRDTGLSKGVAYVQFETERDAERAIQFLDGRGYKNLILRVDWSKPKKSS